MKAKDDTLNAHPVDEVFMRSAFHMVLLILATAGAPWARADEEKADAAHTFTSHNGRIVRAAPLKTPDRHPAAAPGSTRHAGMDENDQIGWGKHDEAAKHKERGREKPTCRFDGAMTDAEIAACRHGG